MNHTATFFNDSSLLSLISALTLDANHAARVGAKLSARDLEALRDDVLTYIGHNQAKPSTLSSLAGRYGRIMAIFLAS